MSTAAEPTRSDSLMACRGVRDLVGKEGSGKGEGSRDPVRDGVGLSWVGDAMPNE